ncbi:aromatic aminobenezylarsenical efflux permease ArsG family transporter [Lentisphaerota bacterium ZTH]|nr:sulfite exporter TauE/SafE family protein [Lentisphaerota bacterium]WET06690.1 aromatic aminobenezylarsenical efflux permease ArsG family transporter [Lentisphaerota bacterium ZTH]
MAGFGIAVVSAFWLGILTSISPCPLATNIAAVSFVGQQVESTKNLLFTGIMYTAGRALTYGVIGILLVESFLSAPVISHLLQKYMNLLLGPVLIVVGMVLLEMISLNFAYNMVSERIKQRAGKAGAWGALLLGILFALSFCPISAVLFFGSLLPLAVKTGSGILLPAVYGLATGVPVLFFSFILALGTKQLASAYNKLAAFEKWGRRTTGILFIIIGVYYCFTRIWLIF